MATPDVHLGPGSHRILRLRPDDGVAEITVDHWLRLADDAPYPELDALPILVSVARIEREREQLEARTGPFGAWLRGDADPEQVAPILAGLPIAAIEVPKFTDGRHYSLARLLRERYGFAGELRVFGDVQPDQLFYMRRCGYTSFDLKPGKSLDTGLRTLEAFSVTYQAAADEAPLYRRRHA